MSGGTSQTWPRFGRSSDDPVAQPVHAGPHVELGFDGAEDLLCAWRDGLTPDPDLTVSAWADKHRVLSSRGASEAVADVAHALSERDHGRAVAIASVSAGRVHETF